MLFKPSQAYKYLEYKRNELIIMSFKYRCFL